MEHLLHPYALPYDPAYPLVCFDERPCFLIGEVLSPLPMEPGRPQRQHYAYQKNGSCSLFVAFEPATGRRWVQVYARRSGREYTRFMQYLQEQFPQAQRIRLVQDNLSTHSPASFYAHLPAAQAFALMERWEWNYTPPRASWLNMVEIELSALSRQCLQRRIGTQEALEREVRAWVAERNRRQVTVRWQFTVHDARQKFAKRYLV
jgi:hypothetical protein